MKSIGMIENIFQKFADLLVPYLDCINIHPNIITLLNFIIGFLCALSLYFGGISMCIMLLFTYYLCDCIDGTLARYSNKTSKFGEKLDHISDILMVVFMTISACLRWYKLPLKYTIPSLIILVLFITIGLINTGCEENEKNIRGSRETLSFTSKLCPNEILDNKIGRSLILEFSGGTLILIIAIVILYMECITTSVNKIKK
jgi:phosphatidylglycerophosphate synthase